MSINLAILGGLCPDLNLKESQMASLEAYVKSFESLDYNRMTTEKSTLKQ